VVREENPICRNSPLHGLSEKKVPWSNGPPLGKKFIQYPSFAGLSRGANFRSLAMLQREAQSPSMRKTE